MKYAYDYANKKMAYIDEDGFNWDEGRLMDPGTYDEEEVKDDYGYTHDHEFNQNLLKADEEFMEDMNGSYDDSFDSFDEEDEQDNDDLTFLDDSNDDDSYDDFDDFD